VGFMLTVLCNVMLRRVPCYGCAFCASLRDTGSKLRGRIFNVLMCKFYKCYICAVVDVIINSTTCTV